MSRTIVFLILVVFLCGAAGCSGDADKDKTKEKGAIQQMAEQVGTDAANAMKDPVEKARKAAALSEAHNKTVQEATKNQ